MRVSFIRSSLLWGPVAVVLFSPPADAVEVNLAPSADTTIMAENAAQSNGAGQHFFSGVNNGGNRRRALIRFDIDGSIPDGSVINTATLSLYMSRSQPVDVEVDLYRLLSDWGESASDAPDNEGGGAAAQLGDATWDFSFFNTTNWTSSGADFAGTFSATTVVGENIGYYAWADANLASDVQAWLDNPATNFGWLIDAPFATTGQSKRFDSRTNPSTVQRPLLTVDFDLATPSGACCAIDGSCTIVDDPGGGCTGTYQGLDTNCSPNLCPEPIGACCLPTADGQCTSETPTTCANQNGTFQGPLTTCQPELCPVVLTPYLDALPIPAVATPVAGNAGGAADYVISARQTQQQLHAELPLTTVWGYDDGVTGPTVPGPTIEAFSNEYVTVEWENDLRDDQGALLTEHHLTVDLCPHGVEEVPHTVVHLHGSHTAAQWDGYPEDHYPPGSSLLFEYPNQQEGSTLWYHDHSLGSTRLNVYMGLAGFFIIRDNNEAGLGLPAGPFEIPLVIQDRQFNTDGSLDYPEAFIPTYVGDHIMVNGKVWPYLDVRQGKYRFRVLNGSGTRTYDLALSDGAQFNLIGTDGGLLEAPIPLNNIVVSPGERVELVVDFENYPPGTDIELVNSAPVPYPGTPGVGVVPEVMQFRVLDQPGYTGNLPTNLRFIDDLLEGDTVIDRDFVLDGMFDPCTNANMFMINDLMWDDITEFPQLGTTEVWRFINNTGMMHPMHIHLDFFQVLDKQPFTMINGEPIPTGPAVPPDPQETGWQDTVQVDPGEMVRVIAQFNDYVGRFPYHCHILEHEDHEMMRQFETVTTCGDGAAGFPGEECDDGGESINCDDDCTFVSCGDGNTNETFGEACDDGGESITCDLDCSLASCGDMQINGTAGEQCDDGGESANCNANCSLSSCGDGILNLTAGEDCDDAGESVDCNINCTEHFCGDSTVNMTAGEECDDGTETVDCNYDCTNTECGDGYINYTADEECDDSGESPGCDDDCSFSECGDNVINMSAGEECDAGGDAVDCDGDCTIPECGDGYNNPLAEACDAGGESSTCDADCTPVECGDGVVNVSANELCDDGNTVSGDGCDENCQPDDGGTGGNGSGANGSGANGTGAEGTGGDGTGPGGETGGDGGDGAGGPPGGCACRAAGAETSGDGDPDPRPLALVALAMGAAILRRKK